MNLAEVDILIPEAELQQKIQELGKKITEDYPDGELMVIGILKGAFIFMADLVRAIDRHIEIDFMEVSSYGKSSTSSGQVRILKDLKQSIEGKHLLFVEDILDSGRTLNYVINLMKQRHPASIKICCLLDKPARRQAPITCDYVGYEIPDEFIVGYGLDYAEKYRNYPAICKLHPDMIND